jgi:hypothetical protein
VIFYLGAHHPHWLAQSTVPLFVSRRALERYKKLPRATVVPWALDSGGFTELTMHGKWTHASRPTTPRSCAGTAPRSASSTWAAPQDWMCEPADDLDGRACLCSSTSAARSTTFSSYARVAPDLPIIPVLQGWSLGDYMEHVEMYDDAGVDLVSERLVGRWARSAGASIQVMASGLFAVLHQHGHAAAWVWA